MMKTHVIGLLILCLALAEPAWGQEPPGESDPWFRQFNTPGWAEARLSASPLAETYDISYELNPFYLRGDFNGDGTADVAILVEARATGKRGIVVLHRGVDESIVLGAGHSIGAAGDDLRRINVWMVYPGSLRSGDRGSSMPDDAAAEEAIYVGVFGSASGVIYWDGNRYLWKQLGD